MCNSGLEVISVPFSTKFLRSTALLFTTSPAIATYTLLAAYPSVFQIAESCRQTQAITRQQVVSIVGLLTCPVQLLSIKLRSMNSKLCLFEKSKSLVNVSRPKISLQYLLNNPVPNLHFKVNPKYSLHLNYFTSFFC
jgi:hypothetical protein